MEWTPGRRSVCILGVCGPAPLTAIVKHCYDYGFSLHIRYWLAGSSIASLVRREVEGLCEFCPGRPVSNIQQGAHKANWGGIVEDTQKALQDSGTDGYDSTIVLVFVHECSGITRVEISRHAIVYSEPTSWKRVNGAHGHEIGDSCFNDKSYLADA